MLLWSTGDGTNRSLLAAHSSIAASGTVVGLRTVREQPWGRAVMNRGGGRRPQRASVGYWSVCAHGPPSPHRPQRGVVEPGAHGEHVP